MKITIIQLAEIKKALMLYDDAELEEEILELELEKGDNPGNILCDAYGIEKRGNRKVINDILENSTPSV